MINRAQELFDVKQDEIREFDVIDDFNNNELYGFICRRSDYRYGAIVLFRINGKPCEQIVWGTPKQHYPFDKGGNFNWPKVSEVQAWEKIDGTNILAYHYECDGNDFITYKTRLTPVIRDMGFGHFKTMWMELLNSKPWIQSAINANPDYNLSFELYGQRNLITIKYETLLDACLLFGVRRSDHAIKPPSGLNVCDCKIPKRYLFSGNNLTESYNELRKDMSCKNESELVTEGVVLYAHIGEPSWKQFKCKPEQIEKIHWANGGIPKNAIWTTAVNAYEIKNEPTTYDLIELLKEEYSETQIGKSIERINKIHGEVYYHMVFVNEVNRAWESAIKDGFDITENKSLTMRYLSKFFDKKEMRRVGSIVLKQAGLI